MWWLGVVVRATCSCVVCCVSSLCCCDLSSDFRSVFSPCVMSVRSRVLDVFVYALFGPLQLSQFFGDNISVFHLAVILGRSNIVAQLLERGADSDVNSRKVCFLLLLQFIYSSCFRLPCVRDKILYTVVYVQLWW